MAEPLKTNIVIGALAEIGVIILLFEVGLESDLGEMLGDQPKVVPVSQVA
ncbi:MAG TPA: hypothetical protein VFY40_10235 [Blastocatellia bacterium]|nr:hypothetical protein [Blastocatellia bacterium]